MWKSLPCEDGLRSLTTVRLTASWTVAEALHHEGPGEASVKGKAELKRRFAQRLVMDPGLQVGGMMGNGTTRGGVWAQCCPAEYHPMWATRILEGVV